jgi:hypothetical protein
MGGVGEGGEGVGGGGGEGGEGEGTGGSGVGESEGETTVNDQTMNTRDYFAAQAMTLIQYPESLRLKDHPAKLLTTAHFKQYTELMAEAAYQIADAMIKARGKKELREYEAAKAKDAAVKAAYVAEYKAAKAKEKS